MSIVGRSYLDPGDKLSGRFNPPRPCVALIGWGPGRGPRNALVRYEDGTESVIPFSRRLRRLPDHRPDTGEADVLSPSAAESAERSSQGNGPALSAPNPGPIGLPAETDRAPETVTGLASPVANAEEVGSAPASSAPNSGTVDPPTTGPDTVTASPSPADGDGSRPAPSAPPERIEDDADHDSCEVCSAGLSFAQWADGRRRCGECDPTFEHITNGDGGCLICDGPKRCATCGQPLPD